MATDKKSFILYADIKTTVDKLNNEYAGKLFKHILAYVNDENPETDDLLLEVAFEPIKRQFKRDLQKWEQIKSKRSEAGKLGGRPKKQEEAKKANGFFEKQIKAKKAVNVNVNVNDNVTVNETVINKKKKDKKEILVYPFDSLEFKDCIKIWKQYKLEQHRFKFKSLASEQAMLKTIGKDYNNEAEAIEAIEYSMANGYKGIFKPQTSLKNGNNDKTQYGSLKTDLLRRFS
tara:strand:+ start:504 stop:1196 length:693 start_codon:yes stop_codon:yes gene_type:complete